MSDKVIVNVASYRRIDSLVKSIESIINQCDEINISLNDHYLEDISELLYNDKINLHFTDNSRGDAFKFLKLTESNGYFFTIDDDLIYPPTYISDTIKRYNEFGGNKIVTYHGRNFKTFPVGSYYRSATERYGCLQRVKNDVKVQFGGTGVMCFHTNLLKLPIGYFKYPNMADVWIGKYCMENNIEIICLKHDEGYIKYIPQKNTIYDSESKNDRLQSLVANSIFDKTIIFENVVLDEIDNKQTILEQVFKPKSTDEKITSTIEKSKKTINYEKVNSVFGQTMQNTIPVQNKQINNPNLRNNTSVLQKLTQKRNRG
jgi:hypothetical protein